MEGLEGQELDIKRIKRGEKGRKEGPFGALDPKVREGSDPGFDCCRE